MDDDLLLAIPGHLVFLHPGFTTPPRLEILEALAEDRWFAVASRLLDDPSAVAVSALILRHARGEDGIVRRVVDPEGRLAISRPFTADTTSLAPGLAGLRAAVRRWCQPEDLVQEADCRPAPCLGAVPVGHHGVRSVDFIGHCFDTAVGRILHLVYDVGLDPAQIIDGSWVPAVDAAALATSILDQRVAPVLRRSA